MESSHSAGNPTCPSNIHDHNDHETQTHHEEQNAAHPQTMNHIISTLPRIEGWIPSTGSLCQYHGFWYPIYLLQGIMAVAEDPSIFNPSPSNIIICSCVKTGTTWLKALTYAIATRTLFNYDVSREGKFDTACPLLNSLPHKLIPLLEFHIGFQKEQNLDSKHPLLSTHIPYTSLPRSIMSSGCKIVYICRDPKDTFVSTWHFTNKQRSKTEPLPIEKAFDGFSRGESPYGPYWDHVLGYWRASLNHPDKVLFLKYEDMMANTLDYVKKLAEFMDYPFSKEEETRGTVERIIELCSFESLSQLKVNESGKISFNEDVTMENHLFFRKGKIGDWKNHLTIEMARKLDTIFDEKLASVGLTL